MASSPPLPLIPMELPFFPIEVWIKIWDFIDFHTLQKKCTIVSKSWFEVIRNTPTLSGEMELKKTIEKEDGTLETLDADGIDSILSHWPMLKVTSLLTHDDAHSTRHFFWPKTNNQPFKKFLSLVFSWVKVVKNWTSF